MFLSFLVALLSLSSSPIWVKWAQAPIEFLGFWRLVIAAFLFLAFELSRHGKSRFLAEKWRDWKWPLLSGIFFFLHLWTYVASAKTTSVAHLVILFSTNPLFTALGAVVFFKEKLRKRLLIVYPLAFCGIWILATEKAAGSGSGAITSLQGDVFALISSALHAAYLLTTKRARRHFANIPFSIGLYLTAGLLFGVAAIVRGSSLETPSDTAWLAIGGLILFPTFLGHALMTQLVNRLNITVLSFGKLLEPGMSSLMAAYFLSEQITGTSLFAFALTGLAVVILLWPQRWMLTK